MSATVTRSMVDQFECIVLQNAQLRAVIIPSLGGRAWELEDRIRCRQWIWHRPDVRLQAAAPGSEYDDVWAGGWEELFPNDAPGEFEGRHLPDHGEWWTTAWEVAAVETGSVARVVLTTTLSVVKALCIKEFTLEEGSSTLSVRYRIRSEEQEPFHFLFKQHLPIAVTPDCRLVLPGGTVTPVSADFSTLLSSGENFAWPTAGTGKHTVDLGTVPPQSARRQEFVYVHDLPAGWCGVQDLRRAASLEMSFDVRVMPYVWLFLTYGGWRDLYTAVLEPCTNMPKDLGEATRLGQSSRLSPGEEFSTRVSVTLSGLRGHTA